MATPDTDLIACLYPVGPTADRLSNGLNGQSRYIPMAPGWPRSSPSLDPFDCPDSPGRLEFRFSHGPQTPRGFIFGRSEDCDVVLPHSPGLSSHHFALTFDEHDRLIIKDLGSRNGTEVTHDGQGKGKHSDFVWVVGGDETQVPATYIVVNVLDRYRFRMVVPWRDTFSQRYINNIHSFLQKPADARLDLRSRSPTGLASGAHAPATAGMNVPPDATEEELAAQLVALIEQRD